MIKVEKIEVFNIEGALRGMRNSWDSHDKSDSFICDNTTEACDCCPYDEDENKCSFPYKAVETDFIIGYHDMSLCKRLITGGTEHRKWARQIMVSMDITAPLYWWKEFDTYKVGTTANSESTMHTIARKDLTPDDFSVEETDKDNWLIFTDYLRAINVCIRRYREYNKKQDWYTIIQMLPSSFNQKRTVTMNYENIFNMIHQRKLHKLKEWRDFCDVMLKLPYMNEFMQEEIKQLETLNGLR